MNRRAIFILASLFLLLVFMSGCKKPTPTPTPEAKAPATEPQPTDTATAVLSTPTTKPKPTATATTEAKVAEPTETSALAKGPELLEPPDETASTVIDLLWTWDQSLGADEWFELQIWPDDPEAEPEAYGWYKKMQERITSANLAPGRYLWRVLVVEGRGDERGEAMELEYAEPWHFILLRPSLKRGQPSLTPVSTDTPIPSATPTPLPVWPTATDTAIPPSPTPTTEPYQPPTREPTPTTEPYEPPEPTATATGEPYEPPEPTATSTAEPYQPPQPTATSTGEPYEPPPATATNSPEPPPTPTEAPEPTAAATESPYP